MYTCIFKLWNFFSYLLFNYSQGRLLNHQYPYSQILVNPSLRVTHRVLLVLDSDWQGPRNAQLPPHLLFRSFLKAMVNGTHSHLFLIPVISVMPDEPNMQIYRDLSHFAEPKTFPIGLLQEAMKMSGLNSCGRSREWTGTRVDTGWRVTFSINYKHQTC